MSTRRPPPRSTSALAFAALATFAAFAALGGCRPPAPARPPAAADVSGTGWGRFRTLQSEHRVTVEAQSSEGGIERRSLRGLIAVERPGRFRLRALGPGGLTLFDLLYVDGKTWVIESIRDPRGAVLSQLLASIASDLTLAYDLEPRPAGRACRVEPPADVVCSEPGHRVRLSDFRRFDGGAAPTRMHIESDRGYRAEIEAPETTLDPALDPALFAPPPGD